MVLSFSLLVVRVVKEGERESGAKYSSRSVAKVVEELQ